MMLPAHVAYSWFAPPSLKLIGISGTAWRGAALQGAVNDVYIRDLTWRIKPLALFTGKAAFETSVATAAGSVSGDIYAGIGGSITLHDASGRLSLADVHPALRQNRIAGSLEFDLDSLDLRDGLPVQAAGKLTLNNLTAGAFGSAPLGTFEATFSSQENGIVGSVADVAAVVDVVGTIELNQDRTYLFLGSVAETSKTPANISQNLRFLGSADANGRRQFRFEGEL